MPTLTDTLTEAFDRIDDFHTVQAANPSANPIEAILCLERSVGIDRPVLELLRARLGRVPGARRNPGPVLFGLILGLMAGQLEAEAGEGQHLDG